MSDLISRKALLEEMNAYKFDTTNDVARRTEHTVKAHMFELVEKQPTAFDLESAIEQLEKEKENSYYEATSKGGRANGKSIAYGENLAYQKALEILKSAANGTNGKNGG